MTSRMLIFPKNKEGEYTDRLSKRRHRVDPGRGDNDVSPFYLTILISVGW
jgi:hypothetical protein